MIKKLDVRTCTVDLAQDMDKWQAFMNTVMNLPVP